MKNKKGFTLIELLAVIVILAIIALIATPIVLNIIEKARKSAYQDSAYGLIEAAKLKYVEGMLDGTNGATTYTFNGTNLGLEFSGSAPDSGQLSVDSNGNVALAVIYGNTCYKKDYTESEVTQLDDTTNCTFESIAPLPPVAAGPICKRATSLHSEECTSTNESYYCRASGYTAENKGTTITYGQLGTGETLVSGDAFDCDVNGDGTYDATTERFYYVSDLYNTTTKSFDSNYAVLVYYNNTTAGVPDNTKANEIAYYPTSAGIYGPVNAIKNLPTTSQWRKASLSNSIRAIVTETGAPTITNSTDTYDLPTSFSYSGYAARLLTTQEIGASCSITAGTVTAGELDNCVYLFENTSFSYSDFTGSSYWIETPPDGIPNSAYVVSVSQRTLTMVTASAKNAVRPAIEVSKTDIEM